MSTPAIDQLMAELMPFPPKPTGQEDWEYRDIPWVPMQFWNGMMKILGAGVVPISMSEADMEVGTRVRGLLLISPEAMKKLSEFNASPIEKKDAFMTENGIGEPD